MYQHLTDAFMKKQNSLSIKIIVLTASLEKIKD